MTEPEVCRLSVEGTEWTGTVAVGPARARLREAGAAAEVAVPTQRLPTVLADLLAVPAEGRAQAAGLELDPAATAGLLRGPDVRGHWRVVTTWSTPGGGPAARAVEAVWTDSGWWTVEPGEATVHLIPADGDTLRQELHRLLPADEELGGFLLPDRPASGRDGRWT